MRWFTGRPTRSPPQSEIHTGWHRRRSTLLRTVTAKFITCNRLSWPGSQLVNNLPNAARAALSFKDSKRTTPCRAGEEPCLFGSRHPLSAQSWGVRGGLRPPPPPALRGLFDVDVFAPHGLSDRFRA